MLSRWYKITVHGDGSDQKVDGEELQISPFWIGNHLPDSSFAALGSDLYSVGGHRRYCSDSDSDSLQSFARSVYKLEISRPDRLLGSCS